MIVVVVVDKNIVGACLQHCWNCACSFVIVVDKNGVGVILASNEPIPLFRPTRVSLHPFFLLEAVAWLELPECHRRHYYHHQFPLDYRRDVPQSCYHSCWNSHHFAPSYSYSPYVHLERVPRQYRNPNVADVS